MGLIIISTINVLLCLLIVLYIGNTIYNKRANIKNISNILVIITYSIYLGINQYYDEKLLKVLIAYIMLMFLYKVIYNQDYNKTILGGFLVYSIMFISETLGGIAITIGCMITKLNLYDLWKYTSNITLIIVILMFIIFSVFKKKIVNVLNQSSHYKTYNSAVIYILLIVALTMTLNKMYMIKWELNYNLAINIIVFSIFLVISLYITRLNIIHKRISTKYSELTEYNKLNDKLLEEYRIKSHEFSNQLTIIKIMHEENNKELTEYLDVLIKKNKNHKYSWINDVKYIQLTGLKGLLNYKIIEMKSLGINTNINISKEVSKFEFENFSAVDKDNLYSIIGVYLDNAKDSAVEAKIKEIVIDIYVENNNLIITIANTYNGNINIEKLGKYNYSTKGKNHGVGLYLVENIVRHSSSYSSKTEITEKYFKQTLYISKTRKKDAK